jgi:YidC/Oxa1 family membrane protein insertase
VWDLLILNPMLNALMLFYGVLGRQFVLAILALTALIRIIVFPLSLKQQRSMVMMQALQGSKEWQEIQKKHKGDREKLSQEQMRMYREFGVNPMGGCLPTLIQFPVLIGLYQSVIRVLASSPLQLVDLAHRVYLPSLAALVPLNSQFLWLDLGRPDPIFVLPVLVVASTWAQQKLLTPPNPDQQAAGMSQSMQVMMPLMMGFFALQFSSALAIYFVISNVVGVAQYAIINRFFRASWVDESASKRGGQSRELRPALAAADGGRKAAAPRKKKKRRKKR